MLRGDDFSPCGPIEAIPVFCDIRCDDIAKFVGVRPEPPVALIDDEHA